MQPPFHSCAACSFLTDTKQVDSLQLPYSVPARHTCESRQPSRGVDQLTLSLSFQHLKGISHGPGCSEILKDNKGNQIRACFFCCQESVGFSPSANVFCWQGTVIKASPIWSTVGECLSHPGTRRGSVDIDRPAYSRRSFHSLVRKEPVILPHIAEMLRCRHPCTLSCVHSTLMTLQRFQCPEVTNHFYLSPSVISRWGPLFLFYM